MRKATIVSGIAVVLLPFLASAQTAASTEHALITALQAEIRLLTQELAQLVAARHAQAPTTASPSASFTCSLTRTLGRGSHGADVTCLQDFLISQSLLPAEDATGYFGTLTEAAVQEFQAAHDLVSSGAPATTGYGVVGPRRRALLATFAAQTSSSSTPPANTPPVVPPLSYGGGGGSSSPPPTCALTVGAPSIVLGSSTALGWSSSNATGGSINQGIGGVDAQGATAVASVCTTTYTGTFTGAGGTVVCTAALAVTIHPRLPVVSALSTTTAEESDTLTLTGSNFAATNTVHFVQTSSSLTQTGSSASLAAALVSLENIFSLTTSPTSFDITVPSANGRTISFAVPATVADGSYMIRVQTQVGRSNGKSLTVHSFLPSCTLSAQASTIAPGSSTKLLWSSAHHAQVSLDHAIGAVGPAGFVTISPATATTYTYTLTATNRKGTASCHTTITVSATPDTTAPTVSITAPANNATVFGTTTVSATAAGNVEVAGVQFKLDGKNLGAADTAAPYSYAWNTASASNGAHTIAAVAWDAAGNRATSTAVIMTVFNTASGNLLTQSAIDTACTTTRTISVNQQVFAVGTTTIPAGCTMSVGKTGLITVAPQGRLLVYGMIAADNKQEIFSIPPIDYQLSLGSGIKEIHSYVQGFGTQSVSVKWFGAKGNGVTNDNDAFYLSSVFGATAQSITVLVPRGTYIVGKQDPLKTLIDKVNANITSDQVNDLKTFLNAQVVDGSTFLDFYPSLWRDVYFKPHWGKDKNLPFLSAAAIQLLNLGYAPAFQRLKDADPVNYRKVTDLRRIIRNALTPTETTRFFSSVLAYQPADIFTFLQTPNVKIYGERDTANNPISKLKLANGLRFGTFDPNTGEPFVVTNASGTPIASLDGHTVGQVGTMIRVYSADTVDISSLELDGSSDNLVLGGYYGDTGYQLSGNGILLRAKRAHIQYIYVHHQGTDGIGISWPGLDDSSPNYPIRLDHIRSEYDGRNALTISNANDLVVSNSAFNYACESKIHSSPCAGVDNEAEFQGVIRNVTFDHVDFIGSRHSQISVTWDANHLTFKHVHAQGNVALWLDYAAGTPGVTFSDSKLEGSIYGIYGDGGRVHTHVGCPTVAYLPNGTKVFLDTSTSTITYNSVDGPVTTIECPGYKAVGVSLATKFYNTQFTFNEKQGWVLYGIGKGVVFDGVTIKSINGQLPRFLAISGAISNSTIEVQNDSLPQNMAEWLVGMHLDNVTFRRTTNSGGPSDDSEYVKCGGKTKGTIVPANTTKKVTTEHIHWCTPTGSIGPIPDTP